METFSYSNGIVSASNGWSYSIRARFDSQLAGQPQYAGIVDGYRHLANMAIGLADDDYRARFGTMPGTNLSEFGAWIDNNRSAVHTDAQGWFTYIPPVQEPPTTGGGGGSAGTGNPPGGNGGGDTGSSGGSQDGFALPMNLVWIGVAALVGMLVLKR